jgi:hypothetical protein
MLTLTNPNSQGFIKGSVYLLSAQKSKSSGLVWLGRSSCVEIKVPNFGFLTRSALIFINQSACALSVK